MTENKVKKAYYFFTNIKYFLFFLKFDFPLFKGYYINSLINYENI